MLKGNEGYAKLTVDIWVGPDGQGYLYSISGRSLSYKKGDIVIVQGSVPGFSDRLYVRAPDGPVTKVTRQRLEFVTLLDLMMERL